MLAPRWSSRWRRGQRAYTLLRSRFDRPGGLLALGLVYAGRRAKKLGRPDAAALAFQAAARVAPDEFRGHLGRAQLFAAQKDWPRAVAAYSEVLRLQPDLESAFSALVAAELARDAPERAEAALLARLRDHPGHAFAWVKLAALQRARGDFAAELATVDGWIASGAVTPAQGLVVGRALARAGRYREALWFFERVPESAKNAPAVLTEMVRAVLRLEGPEGAAKYWRERLAGALPPAEPAQPKRPRRRGPLRVVLASRGTTQFLRPLPALLARRGIEAEVVSLGPEVMPGLAPPERGEHEAHARFQALEGAQPALHAALERADVVWAEWANGGAVWLSELLPPGRRLVVRLHSYEVFGPWPLRIDWRRVDALIVVADHVRDRLAEQVPLERYPGLEVRIVPPGLDSASFRRPKTAAAARTLGVAGYDRANKEPLLALEILTALRRSVPAFRLRLCGRLFAPRFDEPEERAAALEFAARLADLSGAVQIDGWQNDMPAWFEGVGYVLSTSQREGTHEAVAQGMASGAVPVVRRWPVSARFQGAERQYPNALHFDRAEAAAEQILRADRTALGEAAAKEAAARFDSGVLIDAFETALRGDAP